MRKAWTADEIRATTLSRLAAVKQDTDFYWAIPDDQWAWFVKLKDSSGAWVVQPPWGPFRRATIYGVPVEITEGTNAALIEVGPDDRP